MQYTKVCLSKTETLFEDGQRSSQYLIYLRERDTNKFSDFILHLLLFPRGHTKFTLDNLPMIYTAMQGPLVCGFTPFKSTGQPASTGIRIIYDGDSVDIVVPFDQTVESYFDCVVSDSLARLNRNLLRKAALKELNKPPKIKKTTKKEF